MEKNKITEAAQRVAPVVNLPGINQAVRLWNDDGGCCVGGNRAHLILMLRQAGAGANSFGFARWPSPVAAVWERLSRMERLPELRKANLSGANLTETNLTAVLMSQVNLAKAFLTESHLDNADLSGTNLSNADLSGANLYRANLTGTNLMTCANLTNANLLQRKTVRIGLPCPARPASQPCLATHRKAPVSALYRHSPPAVPPPCRHHRQPLNDPRRNKGGQQQIEPARPASHAPRRSASFERPATPDTDGGKTSRRSHFVNYETATRAQRRTERKRRTPAGEETRLTRAPAPDAQYHGNAPPTMIPPAKAEVKINPQPHEPEENAKFLEQHRPVEGEVSQAIATVHSRTAPAQGNSLLSRLPDMRAQMRITALVLPCHTGFPPHT